jgi:hypothetical protein
MIERFKLEETGGEEDYDDPDMKDDSGLDSDFIKAEPWDEKDGLSQERIIQYALIEGEVQLKLNEILSWHANEVETHAPLMNAEAHFSKSDCLHIAAMTARKSIPDGRVFVKELVKVIFKLEQPARDAQLHITDKKKE